PDRLVHGLVGEQAGAVGDGELGAAVLAGTAPGHLAAQLLGDELGAVADAEDGDAELVDLGVEAGGALDVDRPGTPGQHDGRRPALAHLGRGDRVGDDLGVDVRLADPPGDELGVLRPEVDDQAGREPLARRRGRAHSSPTTTRSAFCRSFSVSNPHSAIARRRAPVRFTLPEASWAGPWRICSSVPWG